MAAVACQSTINKERMVRILNDKLMGKSDEGDSR